MVPSDSRSPCPIKFRLLAEQARNQRVPAHTEDLHGDMITSFFKRKVDDAAASAEKEDVAVPTVGKELLADPPKPLSVPTKGAPLPPDYQAHHMPACAPSTRTHGANGATDTQSPALPATLGRKRVRKGVIADDDDDNDATCAAAERVITPTPAPAQQLDFPDSPDQTNTSHQEASGGAAPPSDDVDMAEPTKAAEPAVQEAAAATEVEAASAEAADEEEAAEEVEDERAEQAEEAEEEDTAKAGETSSTARVLKLKQPTKGAGSKAPMGKTAVRPPRPKPHPIA